REKSWGTLTIDHPLGNWPVSMRRIRTKPGPGHSSNETIIGRGHPRHFVGTMDESPARTSTDREWSATMHAPWMKLPLAEESMIEETIRSIRDKRAKTGIARSTRRLNMASWKGERVLTDDSRKNLARVWRIDKESGRVITTLGRGFHGHGVSVA